MSILIKSMEMPHDCLECYEEQFCKEYQDEENKRPYGCPLVEIPKHGRLIDASEMAIKLNCLDIDIATVKKIHELLMETPTVIESEEQENE